jgi:hypothetical protein
VKRDQNVDSYTGFPAPLIETKIINHELTPLLRNAEGLSKNWENKKDFIRKMKSQNKTANFNQMSIHFRQIKSTPKILVEIFKLLVDYLCECGGKS